MCHFRERWRCWQILHWMCVCVLSPMSNSIYLTNLFGWKVSEVYENDSKIEDLYINDTTFQKFTCTTNETWFSICDWNTWVVKTVSKCCQAQVKTWVVDQVCPAKTNWPDLVHTHINWCTMGEERCWDVVVWGPHRRGEEKTVGDVCRVLAPMSTPTTVSTLFSFPQLY
jgi:hypothetical protein